MGTPGNQMSYMDGVALLLDYALSILKIMYNMDPLKSQNFVEIPCP